VFTVGRRQVARHHHRAGRHATVMNFTGLAIVDARALADIDAHRDHRVFLDHNALGDFRTRTDEHVVFDDHRTGLNRFQHTADANAAGEVDVLADLRAGTDGGPSVDH